MEGIDETPSTNTESSSEGIYDPTQGFCLYTLVQYLRGFEKEKLQPVITEAVEHACSGEMESRDVGGMEIDFCTLNCRRDSCRVEISYWELTVGGEPTYTYSHSKEEVDSRGCVKEDEWRNKTSI
jgi:hypothetical protein